MDNHSKVVTNAADSTAESDPRRKRTTRLLLWNEVSERTTKAQQNKRLTRSSFVRLIAQPDNQSGNHENNTDGNNNTKVTSSTDFLGRPPPQASSANDDDEFDYIGRPLSREPIESNSSRNSTPPAVASTSESSDSPSERSTPSDAAQRNRRKQNAPKKRKEQAYKKIKRLQYSTNFLIAKLPFQRTVREVLQSYKKNFRMQTSSLECLQEAAESYLVQLFEDSYLCTQHRNVGSQRCKFG